MRGQRRRLHSGDYETAGESQTEARRLFLAALVRLDPRGVVSDLHARYRELGRDVTLLESWATGAHLLTPWVLDWAREMIYRWRRFPQRHAQRKFGTRIRPVSLSPLDSEDRRPINSHPLAAVAGHPDQETHDEFLARVEKHWQRRVQQLVVQNRAQPAQSKDNLAHFDWLVRYQVREESSPSIARSARLRSGAAAVMPRLKELSMLLDLPLRPKSLTQRDDTV